MPRKQRFKPSRKPQAARPEGPPPEKHQEVSDFEGQPDGHDVERDAPARVEDAERSH